MQSLKGPIESVTVYRTAAVVTRRATVELSPGTHEVEFVGLPLALTDASVRVQAEVDEGAVDVAQVRVGLFVAPQDDLPEPPDQAELKAVERAVDRLQRKLTQLEVEQRVLTQLEAPARPEPAEGQPPGPSPLAARLALDGFVSTTVAERATEIQDLDRELDVLLRKQADLQQRLELASTAQRVDVREVTKSAQCRLVVPEGTKGPVRVTARYQVPGARWFPSYQVRVTDDRADVVLRAIVDQQSGEDWTGVHLDVSTAAPLSWTELPKMTALRIGRQQDLPVPPTLRPAPAGGDVLFADYDAQRRRLSPPKNPVFVRVLNELTPPVELAVPAEKSRALDADGGMTERADFRLSAYRFGASQEYDDDVLEAEEAEGVEAARWAGSAAEAAPTSAPAPAPEAPPRTRMRRKVRRELSDEDQSAPMARSVGLAITPAGQVNPLALKQSLSLQSNKVPPAAAVEAQVFDELTLAGPTSRRRGSLQRSHAAKFYEETALRAGRPLGFEPAAAVSEARTRAARVARGERPPSTDDPKSSAGNFDYTYPALSPVDIPSDGAFHSVPLSVRSAPCELTYVTVPRFDRSVYRQAQLTNPEASPLLSGPAEIYVDGEYVLTARLPTVAAHGRVDLGLGVEQSVRCVRNVRFREARSSDKVVATNDLHHELRFTLANDLDRDVQCEVRERIPIPDEDAEVVVEERNVEPAWEAYEQKERRCRIKGGRRWRVTIPARKEIELNATYVVRIYGNHQIAGGNRREG